MTKKTFNPFWARGERGSTYACVIVTVVSDGSTFEDVGDSEAAVKAGYVIELRRSGDDTPRAILQCELWAWRDEAGAIAYDCVEEREFTWTDFEGRPLNPVVLRCFEFLAGTNSTDLEDLIGEARAQMLRGMKETAAEALAHFEAERAER